jgi:hypothetical protein
MRGFDEATRWGKGTGGMFPIGLSLGNAISGQDTAACPTGASGRCALRPCCSREALFTSVVKNQTIENHVLASNEIKVPLDTCSNDGLVVRESSQDRSSNAPLLIALINHSKMNALLASNAAAVIPISSSSF